MFECRTALQESEGARSSSLALVGLEAAFMGIVFVGVFAIDKVVEARAEILCITNAFAVAKLIQTIATESRQRRSVYLGIVLKDDWARSRR